MLNQTIVCVACLVFRLQNYIYSTTQMRINVLFIFVMVYNSYHRNYHNYFVHFNLQNNCILRTINELNDLFTVLWKQWFVCGMLREKRIPNQINFSSAEIKYTEIFRFDFIIVIVDDGISLL